MPSHAPHDLDRAAADAERALTRALLIAGVALLVLFFLPWVIKGDRWIFTWGLIRGGSLGRIIFLVWIPVAAVNLLALGLAPWRGSALRAALAIAVGVVPLLALCATPITFGQPPPAVPDTLGYGLLAAMPLLAFGLHHRAMHRRSRAARAAVAAGLALVVAGFGIPREVPGGTVWPLPWLLERATEGAGWAGGTVYLVLPLPLAALALSAFSSSTRWDRLLFVLRWYFQRFVAGLYVLLAFPAFVAERGEIYRPYVIFVGVTITLCLGCAVAGASALLAHLYRRAARPSR